VPSTTVARSSSTSCGPWIAGRLKTPSGCSPRIRERSRVPNLTVEDCQPEATRIALSRSRRHVHEKLRGVPHSSPCPVCGETDAHTAHGRQRSAICDESPNRPRRCSSTAGSRRDEKFARVFGSCQKPPSKAGLTTLSAGAAAVRIRRRQSTWRAGGCCGRRFRGTAHVGQFGLRPIVEPFRCAPFWRRGESHKCRVCRSESTCRVKSD